MEGHKHISVVAVLRQESWDGERGSRWGRAGQRCCEVASLSLLGLWGSLGAHGPCAWAREGSAPTPAKGAPAPHRPHSPSPARSLKGSGAALRLRRQQEMAPKMRGCAPGKL